MKVGNLTVYSIGFLYLFLFVFVCETPQTSMAQDPAYELPVQLVGFPVIILFVRLANFVRKLSYSLSPSTYRRQTRSITNANDPYNDLIDVNEAEKRLISEMGQGYCIYERVCAQYASRALRKRERDRIDWPLILSQYKRSPARHKEYYLLSVFLGDIVASPNLCHQLAKRGRSCTSSGEVERR